MTLEQAILAALPGTGRQIADKVQIMNVPQASMVTPNVVYAVMQKNRKAVRRSLISGGESKSLRLYFEAK
jgi:hypothetical protein